ncbi:MAG TPA: hypothetical protein VIP46_08820 [Pyrinomonadaceae bacterium]
MHTPKRHVNRLARRGGLALLLSSLALLATAFGPLAPTRQCPTLNVSGPVYARANERMTYNASPDVGRSFNWTVSAGSIASGQGSAQIEVTDVYTGSVKVAAVNPGCNNQASKITEIVAFVPTPEPPCPTVSVTCPDHVVEGESLTFTASVSGADPNVEPTFNWTVSAGSISSGQGTPTIKVDTAGVGGQTITATVDVGGYARQCSMADSCTAALVKRPKPARLDEYDAITFNDEKARLDNFVVALQNEPTAQGYIIVYSGRREGAGGSAKRGERARSYLVSRRGVDEARIVVVEGGRRAEPSAELWLVPTGATPPTPSPTKEPTR